MLRDMEFGAKEKQKGWLIAGTFLAMVAYLLFVPGTGVDGILRCPFRWLTGYSCPGCGMTRATTHALHGSWAASFEHHPLGVPFVLSYGGLALFHAAQNVVGRQLAVPRFISNKRAMNIFWWTLLVFLLAHGAIRFGLEVAGILTPI